MKLAVLHMTTSHLLWRVAIVVAVSMSGPAVSPEIGFSWLPTAAAAQGHSGGHSGSHGGTDSDHDDDHGGGHSPGSKGNGSHGAHGHDVARGGGKSVETRIFRDTRPVWAQGGIPEVELGRLNVSRAPGRILTRAEEEALATYTQEMAALYSLDAIQAAQLLEASFRDLSRYDSPLQNLALYKDVMTFGDTRLKEIDPGLQPASQLDLAAIFLGSASDKTIPISEDTVVALNRILGLVDLSAEDRTALASKAEAVRSAILTGHGAVDTH